MTRFLGFNAYELSSSRTPRSSGYYNLTGSKITIDDSDSNYNWSKTVAENDWCSGAGTIEDPYIIENVYIDGQLSINETSGKQHSANCLSIYRSTAYFIVRGCYFTRAGTDEFNSGIYLAYAENGIIYNNTLTYSHTNMFVNDRSHNTTVMYNIMMNNASIYGPNRACGVGFSDDCLVTRNLVDNCYTGIQLLKSRNVRIRQNLLNSTLFGHPVEVGVDLSGVNDSIITYNVFAGDFIGTTFEVYRSQSSGNTIQNNTYTGTTPDLNVPSLQTSSDYTHLIALANSFSNVVSHNIAYVPGYIPEIPGYNLFIVLGAISVISMISIMAILIKAKRKSKF